jgi:hypothetical protein
MKNTWDVCVEHDSLVIGSVRVTFERTLRIPEDGLHPLPPGLGAFPLRRVEDYLDTVPASWIVHGGVMLPIYQREAMWLDFASGEPAALQVAIGKVCAVSGKPWKEKLTKRPQNYVALPDQPWLDGINSGDGFIRQFVAAPLGSGATVEGQVTGEEIHGGIQLRAVGLTKEALKEWRKLHGPRSGEWPYFLDYAVCASVPDASEMGLGAGGRMRQEIYTDDRKLRDYDPARSARVFVHLCSATQWTAITGETPPPTPVDREAYVRAGLPWFDYYDADHDDVPASEILSKVKAVGEVLGNHDEPSTPVHHGDVVVLKGATKDIVKGGKW